MSGEPFTLGGIPLDRFYRRSATSPIRAYANLTYLDCVVAVEDITRALGGGFHPDTPGADYVGPDGQPTFTPREARLFDALVESIDRSLTKIGAEDIYEIAVERQAFLDPS